MNKYFINIFIVKNMSGSNTYTIYLTLILILLSKSDYEDFTTSPIYPNDKYSNPIILK